MRPTSNAPNATGTQTNRSRIIYWMESSPSSRCFCLSFVKAFIMV
nr:MAG TPA: hypothetical protein [Bacteriophage sp.]